MCIFVCMCVCVLMCNLVLALKSEKTIQGLDLSISCVGPWESNSRPGLAEGLLHTEPSHCSAS